jgi:N-acetylglutamate synthase-like GNAT family acetyltransferase
MPVQTRPFDPARDDFEQMVRFLQEDYAAKRDDFVWLSSRLGDWKYGLWHEQKYFPSFFRKHAQLWFDSDDKLLGFVLSEDGGSDIAILVRNGHEDLYAGILAWTIAHWGPRHATLKIEVHSRQSAALQALERAGFRSRGEVAVTRVYDLTAKATEPVRLRPGYRIVDMLENSDWRSKGLLYRSGFHDEDQVSTLDLLKFEYNRESPAYNPAFDLSVIAADGAHVATCVGFADPAARMAEIEKVCTHARYRRLGLAESVIRECFHRLRRSGIERAYITGYSKEANGLYEKLGPCARKWWSHYALMLEVVSAKDIAGDLFPGEAGE